MLSVQTFLSFSFSNSSAFALRCYFCHGTEDICNKSKLKGDKGTFLQSCPYGDKCYRYWIKVKDSDGIVTNGCGFQSTCDSLKSACDRAKDATKDYHCAIGCCSEDGCNASSYLTANIILLTVSSVLGLALLK